MKSLSEKVIVIMGASSGIGEATARLLARKGAKLVIAARRQERLIAIKKELPEATILVDSRATSRCNERRGSSACNQAYNGKIWTN